MTSVQCCYTCAKAKQEQKQLVKCEYEEYRHKAPLLGCTPQACKPCGCPSSSLKSQHRDTSGLMERGSYTSETEGTLPQQTGGGSNLCSLGEKQIATMCRGNCPRVGSPVIRATGSWAHPSPPLRLTTATRADGPL